MTMLAAHGEAFAAAHGHRGATGGQVRVETWSRLTAEFGFGRDARVS